MFTIPLKQFEQELLKKFPELERLDLYQSGNDIRLDTIIVKRQFRKSGIGSKVLKDIKSFADSNLKRIILTTGVKDSAWGTTSSSRLDKFYRRNGFVASKNRNKDFTITATHYYDGRQNIKEGVGEAIIEINGKQHHRNNSLGKPIHPTDEGIKNFYKWFGDSKVTDEQGRPLVVYHGTGTSEPIDTFNRKHLVQTRNKIDGIDSIGIWFTNSKFRVNDYTSSAVYAAYLKIENPRIYKSFSDLRQEWSDTQSFKSRTASAKARLALHKMNPHHGSSDEFLNDWITGDGFDGIIINTHGDSEWRDQTAFVVLNPVQIKSVIGNNGKFNPNSTKITEMKHTYRADTDFDQEYDMQEKRRKPKKKKREVNEDKLEQRGNRVNFKNYLREIKEHDLDEDF